MSEWAESIARPLRALHLDSIRNRIVVFVVLTALIPTGHEELIASADAAMYQAKTGGRDRVVAAGANEEKEKRRRRKGEK